MLLIIIMFICLGVTLFFHKKSENTGDGWCVGYVVSIVCIAGLLLAIAIIVSKGVYLQREDKVALKKTINIERIYRDKADELTLKFSTILATKYQEHEKDIYEKIKPENVDLYFAKYPELKSSTTLINLVERINKLEDDTYAQQVLAQEIIARMRFRLENPCSLTFLIPAYPELLQEE